MKTINFQEAQSEAKQLSRNLRRNVEVKSVNCDCDYEKHYGKCAGEGVYYDFVFAFCGHLVADDDRCEECFEDFCAEREKVQGETFPTEGAQLKSCFEVESERRETEEAA